MGVKYTISYGQLSKEIVDVNNSSFVLTYGSRSETMPAGSGKTLDCKIKVMSANLSVGSHTLSCANKIMKDNVIISSQQYNPVATITITGDAKGEASAVINGTEYKQSATVTVPFGTVITLKVWGTWLVGGKIYVNDTQVASGSSKTYDVTAMGDATIDFSGSTSTYGRLHYTGQVA